MDAEVILEIVALGADDVVTHVFTAVNVAGLDVSVFDVALDALTILPLRTVLVRGGGTCALNVCEMPHKL